MNKVKDWKSIKILGAVALFAVVLAVASVPATAQTVQSNAVVNTAPIGAGDDLLGNVATGVITTNAVGYDIRGHATVATQITTFGLGAGATNSLVVLTQTSNNKTNWQTLATTTLIAAGASDAGTIVTSTGVGAHYARIFTVSNNANGVGTNLNWRVTVNAN
jgi:hypothetical protein